MSGVEIQVRANVSKARIDLGKLENSVSNIQTRVERANSAFVRMGAAITSLLAIKGLSSGLSGASDAMITLENKVALVVGRGKELQLTLKELRTVAKSTGADINTTTDTFNRFGLSLRDTKVNTNSLLRATQLVAKAAKISGTSAETARASIIQLGQGLGAGELRGQELMSVMEGIPRLARAIADGMGKPFGQLKKLAEAGQLTASTVFNAILEDGKNLDKEFKLITFRIADFALILGDEFKRMLGNIDKVLGASTGLKVVIRSLTEAFTFVADNVQIWAKRLKIEFLIVKIFVKGVFFDITQAIKKTFDYNLATAAFFTSITAVEEVLRAFKKFITEDIFGAIRTAIFGNSTWTDNWKEKAGGLYSPQFTSSIEKVERKLSSFKTNILKVFGNLRAATLPSWKAFTSMFALEKTVFVDAGDSVVLDTELGKQLKKLENSLKIFSLKFKKAREDFGEALGFAPRITTGSADDYFVKQESELEKFQRRIDSVTTSLNNFGSSIRRNFIEIFMTTSGHRGIDQSNAFADMPTILENIKTKLKEIEIPESLDKILTNLIAIGNSNLKIVFEAGESVANIGKALSKSFSDALENPEETQFLGFAGILATRLALKIGAVPIVLTGLLIGAIKESAAFTDRIEDIAQGAGSILRKVMEGEGDVLGELGKGIARNLQAIFRGFREGLFGDGTINAKVVGTYDPGVTSKGFDSVAQELVKGAPQEFSFIENLQAGLTAALGGIFVVGAISSTARRAMINFGGYIAGNIFGSGRAGRAAVGSFMDTAWLTNGLASLAKRAGVGGAGGALSSVLGNAYRGLGSKIGLAMVGGMVAEIANSAFQDSLDPKEKNFEALAASGNLAAAGLEGALYGATVGSVIPIIGTSFGAALGAAVGVGMEYFNNPEVKSVVDDFFLFFKEGLTDAIEKGMGGLGRLYRMLTGQGTTEADLTPASADQVKQLTTQSLATQEASGVVLRDPMSGDLYPEVQRQSSVDAQKSLIKTLPSLERALATATANAEEEAKENQKFLNLIMSNSGKVPLPEGGFISVGENPGDVKLTEALLLLGGSLEAFEARNKAQESLSETETAIDKLGTDLNAMRTAFEVTSGFINGGKYNEVEIGLLTQVRDNTEINSSELRKRNTLLLGGSTKKVLRDAFVEALDIYTTKTYGYSSVKDVRDRFPFSNTEQQSSLLSHASGGLIRGSGTATSDSIPHMLSNGEFVMQASAVSKFGPQWMAAVNNGIMPQQKAGGGGVNIGDLDAAYSTILTGYSSLGIDGKTINDILAEVTSTDPSDVAYQVDKFTPQLSPLLNQTVDPNSPQAVYDLQRITGASTLSQLKDYAATSATLNLGSEVVKGSETAAQMLQVVADKIGLTLPSIPDTLAKIPGFIADVSGFLSSGIGFLGARKVDEMRPKVAAAESFLTGLPPGEQESELSNAFFNGLPFFPEGALYGGAIGATSALFDTAFGVIKGLGKLVKGLMSGDGKLAGLGVLSAGSEIGRSLLIGGVWGAAVQSATGALLGGSVWTADNMLDYFMTGKRSFQGRDEKQPFQGLDGLFGLSNAGNQYKKEDIEDSANFTSINASKINLIKKKIIEETSKKFTFLKDSIMSEKEEIAGPTNYQRLQSHAYSLFDGLKGQAGGVDAELNWNNIDAEDLWTATANFRGPNFIQSKDSKNINLDIFARKLPLNSDGTPKDGHTGFHTAYNIALHEMGHMASFMDIFRQNSSKTLTNSFGIDKKLPEYESDLYAAVNRLKIKNGRLEEETAANEYAKRHSLSPLSQLFIGISQSGYMKGLGETMTKDLAKRGLAVQGYSTGGAVYGDGGPTDDKIPAMLSNKEYIIKASAHQKFGTSFLDKINAGVNPIGFNTAGKVDSDFKTIYTLADVLGTKTITIINKAGESEEREVPTVSQEQLNTLNENLRNFNFSGNDLGKRVSNAITNAVRQGNLADAVQLASEYQEIGALKDALKGVLDSDSIEKLTGAARELAEQAARDAQKERSQDIAADLRNTFISSLQNAFRTGDFGAIADNMLDSFTASFLDHTISTFSNQLFKSLGTDEMFTGLFTGAENFGLELGGGTAIAAATGMTKSESKTGEDAKKSIFSTFTEFGSSIFGTIQSGLGNMLNGLLGKGGGGGLFHSFTSLFGAGQSFGNFLGLFSQGGVVPNTSNSIRGKDSVPAMLTPGEMILSTNQVRNLKNNSSSNSQQIINLNITGDISRQTKSEVYKMIPQIASGINANNKENNFKY